MTKAQLIGIVAGKVQHLSHSEVKNAVEAVFESMSNALSENRRIEIRGFGVFCTRIRRARDGRNPRTGGSVRIPRKKAPFFKAGKDLKNRANSVLRRKARG